MFKLLLMMQLVIIPLKGYRHDGRRDTTKPYVVLHSDESATTKGALSWLKKTRKSYHYYIDRAGKVYQLVDPKFQARHAGWSLYDGLLHWNDFSIGVAFANKSGPYTEAQYRSGKLLMDFLRKKYPNLKIVTHHDIAKFRGKTDPKDFDVSRLGEIDGHNK